MLEAMRSFACFLLLLIPALAADDRVKFDNDAVRVLKVVDEPRIRNRHCTSDDFNRVMVYSHRGRSGCHAGKRESPAPALEKAEQVACGARPAACIPVRTSERIRW